MGEFDNETQSSDRHDEILHTIDDLADLIIWRFKFFLPLRLVKMIPFGEYILSPFIKNFARGEACTKNGVTFE